MKTTNIMDKEKYQKPVSQIEVKGIVYEVSLSEATAYARNKTVPIRLKSQIEKAELEREIIDLEEYINKIVLYHKAHNKKLQKLKDAIINKYK
tara:strand:- start:1156 stop:1434 length:279 start_codon:yes stop_codon:yes gene_type:complete